ncbi:MAG: transketolase, partial [Mycobacteriales bacterium]
MTAPSTATMTGKQLEHVRALAAQLRVDSIRCSTQAGSGHPTSSLSAADLMAGLLIGHLHYDWDRPNRADNDHLIFSKGHASPLLYSMFRAVGAIDEAELVDTYRQLGARLEGHPTPVLPWVDVATGSLGQGLPDAVGVGIAGKYLDKLPYHVWVLCGDSETAEGSIWEALDKAGYYRLGNLTAIVDINRLGQRGPTELEWDVDRYAARVAAFGCRPLPIDGHDPVAIDRALRESRTGSDQPTVVLARTVKAKGVPELEDKNGWHGKALPPEMAERAIAALGGVTHRRITTTRPQPGIPAITADPTAAVTLPVYELGEKIATRAAFGAAIAALAARPEIVVVDGEVGNSTHAEEFGKVAPERYFEMFIGEQQLVAATVGLAVRGYVAFAATFAVFFSRAYDFIRMAGISRVNIRLVGSHAGVEIGADGPSQMGLEDLAALRAVHGSVVLYPADATCTAALVALMADTAGIVYLRTTRGAYPVRYGPEEDFTVGGSKTHRAGPADQVALIGAGVTLHECLAAADELAAAGIAARVIDAYSVKPIDRDTLIEAARVTGGRLVVAEDHYPEGGLGGAVLEALADAAVPGLRVAHLALRDLPGSGTPDELLNEAGISTRQIADAARRLVGVTTFETQGETAEEASMKPTQALHEAGQSLWLDNITRGLLDRGTMQRYITDCSTTGLTSNPTIFDKAIEAGSDYDADIATWTAAGASAEEVFFELALADLRRAAELFAPAHQQSDGVDGWVSLEVSPLVAHDTAATIAQATALHAKADRPNVFIKIPGTPEGLPAIEECTFAGIPINVTLLFSAGQYTASAEAYLRGIERRVRAHLDPAVGAVASVFVSRWDTAVADRIQVPDELRNRLGIAEAALAYRAYRELLDAPRWERLANEGARPQRLLWASTSTKDPGAPDLLYVHALAAPFTINTMPEATLLAYPDHGHVSTLMAADGGDAEHTLA